MVYYIDPNKLLKYLNHQKGVETERLYQKLSE